MGADDDLLKIISTGEVTFERDGKPVRLLVPSESVLEYWGIQQSQHRKARWRQRRQRLWGEQVPKRVASIAAWLGGKSRAWRGDEWAADLAQSPHPIRYSLGLIRGALRMRLHSVAGLSGRGLRWVLVSEWRTWVPLTTVTAGAAFENAASQGPWSAAFMVLTGAPALYGGVVLLRKFLQVKPQQRQPSDRRD